MHLVEATDELECRRQLSVGQHRADRVAVRWAALPRWSRRRRARGGWRPGRPRRRPPAAGTSPARPRPGCAPRSQPTAVGDAQSAGAPAPGGLRCPSQIEQQPARCASALARHRAGVVVGDGLGLCEGGLQVTGFPEVPAQARAGQLVGLDVDRTLGSAMSCAREVDGARQVTGLGRRRGCGQPGCARAVPRSTVAASGTWSQSSRARWGGGRPRRRRRSPGGLGRRDVGRQRPRRFAGGIPVAGDLGRVALVGRCRPRGPRA